MKRLSLSPLFVLTLLAALVAAAPRMGGRIVGGYEVDIRSIPFQVSLQKGSNHYCGGSLIAKRYVLTAAHCTEGYSSTNSGIKVRLGSKYTSRGGLLVEIIKIIQHKEFNPGNVRHDIAVLKLKDYDDSWIPFQIEYAELPLENDIEDGTPMIVSGWGYTHTSTESHDVLRAVVVPKISNAVCRKDYENFNQITEDMICAGHPEGGKDACQGDSGGPLFRNNVIWGIVSWGYGCARPNYPGVYSRITSALEWIKSTIEEE